MRKLCKILRIIEMIHITKLLNTDIFILNHDWYSQLQYDILILQYTILLYDCLKLHILIGQMTSRVESIFCDIDLSRSFARLISFS